MQVIFLRGLPGSGKSEWAHYFKEHKNEVVILSFDDILKEYDPAGYEQDYTAAVHKNYREVTNLLMSRLTALSFTDYTTAIVDSLNLDYQQVCDLGEALKVLDTTFSVKLINFFITVDDSIRRQQRRKGHTVAEDKVVQMDVALRKVYSCIFPGEVVNLRFDTQELITVGSGYEDDTGKEIWGYQMKTGSFAPDKALLI